MKYYKIKLFLDGTPKGYPPGYVSTEKRDGIDKLVKEFLYFKEYPDEFKMVALPNNVKFKHKNVTELTFEEAEAIADEHAPKKTFVTDEAILRVIEIKSRLGHTLSEAEEKALDPDDKTPGIGWKMSMREKLGKLKNG